MSFIISRASRFCLTPFARYSLKCISAKQTRSLASDQRPLMLMDVPRVVYPNLFFTVRNFFSRLIINGYFDPTFSVKPFSDGARQALTVVSQLIANGQFDDLSGFVTREVEQM